MWRSSWWDVAAGVVILLGLVQVPSNMGLARLMTAGASAGWAGAGLVLVDLVPVLPFLLALAVLAGVRIGGVLVWAVIGVSALPAVLLTLGAAYDSGGGAGITLVLGAALTLGCWGMLWRMAGRPALGRVALGVALLVAIWSLATPFAVATLAWTVAGQDAFCIARHAPERPIRSWAELRGVSFYTTRSGFKDTSAWYLHGVLLVQRPEGTEAWNWSPRGMTFERLDQPGILFQSPFGTCTPGDRFLAGLALM